MKPWQTPLKFDSLAPLLSSGDEALRCFVQRDLLGEDPGPVECLWNLPAVLKILKKQQADGSWLRPGEHRHPAINDALIETWRQFRFLVEQYGLTREHPQVRLAAEYLFSCQTEEGDIRGMLANQYATYYTGAIMALLIQAGYAEDARIEKGFEWLLSMRQSDGGWSIPLITHTFDRETQYRLTSEFEPPVQPDRTKPFSHNGTGMVLRAFAVHPTYRSSEAALAAARLLASKFLQPDAYTSYQAASYWVRFEFPFWWNNLLSATDSLSRMGFTRENESMQLAASWFIDHQETGGLWKVSYAKPEEEEKETAKIQDMKRWVSLAICRVLVRLYS